VVRERCRALTTDNSLFVEDHPGPDQLRVITLNNSATANALSPAMVGALADAISAARVDPTRGLLIRSIGPTFSAGFDLRDLGSQTDDSLRARFRALQAVLDELTKAPFITYAVVEGPAVGAGADLALACDFRVGTAKARFRFPGSHFGLVLGLGRLRSIAGSTRALEAMGGDWIDTDAAETWGLITHRAKDDGAALQTAVELHSALERIDPHALHLGLDELRRPNEPGIPLLERSLTDGLHSRLTMYVQRRDGR
jgi:enoyl-CoA hydratase